MRPGDAVFQGQEGLPTWAVTLIRELRRGGKEASPHLLTPLAALDEVIATASSVASGRSQIREADRVSLGKDVSASLKSLGPVVQKVSGAVLCAFQSDDLRRLPQLLADVDGARRARSSAKALIAELLLPRTSRAAWDDVVQAFETPTPFEKCTVRIAQLREISVRRGQSWDAVERQLVGVLSDRLHHVAGMGAVDVEVTNENLRDLAGLSLERRIELCRAAVGDAPVEEHSIVWMVFGHAVLRASLLRTGPVQFFNGDLPLTAIRDGCPALDTPDFERPVELEHPMADTFFDELPERPFVLARVDVDSRHVADARRFARDLVSGLVEVAHRDTAWLLYEGEAVFTAGQWWGTMGFGDPRQILDQDDPRYDRTGELLEELEPGIVERLVTADERTASALTQRRWERAVAAAEDPAQRLTLAMRTLEEALPIGRAAGGSVRESCERYLMETWSMGTLHGQLRDAAYYGTSSALRPGTSRDRTELRNAILPSTGDLSFTFKPGMFMERITEVLSGLDELTMQHRMVAEAADWVSSASAMDTHIEELDGRFRRLLARTIRQRNAVVHGAQTVPQVIASCEPFIRELCGQVVAQALAAAADGEDSVDRLEGARAAWLRQRAALRDGKQPASVLFTGPLTED